MDAILAGACPSPVVVAASKLAGVPTSPAEETPKEAACALAGSGWFAAVFGGHCSPETATKPPAPASPSSMPVPASKLAAESICVAEQLVASPADALRCRSRAANRAARMPAARPPRSVAALSFCSVSSAALERTCRGDENSASAPKALPCVRRADGAAVECFPRSLMAIGGEGEAIATAGRSTATGEASAATTPEPVGGAKLPLSESVDAAEDAPS